MGYLTNSHRCLVPHPIVIGYPAYRLMIEPLVNTTPLNYALYLVTVGCYYIYCIRQVVLPHLIRDGRKISLVLGLV